MTTITKLMRLEDIEKWLSAVDEPTKSVHLYPKCTGEKGGDAIGVYIIAKQLADTMRENERLREALEFYANPGDYKAPYTAGLGKLYFDCGTKAKEALASSKHSVVENGTKEPGCYHDGVLQAGDLKDQNSTKT